MKKRMLYAVVVLALVLGLALPMAAPVMASEIQLAKNTIPLLPNAYYLSDTIYYVLNVTNPIGNPATNYIDEVWDELPDGSKVTLDTNVTQAPGEWNAYYYNYTVAEADLQWIGNRWRVQNILHADGTDSLDDVYNATTSKNSLILRPAISIEKTVDFDNDGVFTDSETYYAGQPADWAINVTNTGYDPVYNITVSDDNNGADFYGPFDLAVNETRLVPVYTTNPTAYTLNTACAQGVDEIGGTVGPVCDPAEVFILNPELCIDKTVDCNDDGVYSKTETTYGPSDDADWKVVVTNCGPDPVYNITVTDTNAHVFGSQFDLAVGANMTFTYTTTITTTTTNTATAVGKDEIGGTVGPVFSSATNKIINPELCIDKTVDCNDDGVYSKTETTSGPSDDADWKVVVTNCGTDPVYNITVTDTNAHSFGSQFDLAVGANMTFTYTTTITTTTTNTATAVGKDEIGGTVGPVSSSATNEIITARLCIDKTVDCNDDGVYSKTETTTGPSDDADWKVVVTNCGDVPVYNITVTDTNAHVFGAQFDLAVGANMTFTYTTTITTTTTNTATAVGKDEVGGTVGPVSSSATNRIVGIGCLEICKFQDSNVNGMWDPGEPWLPDWRFHVTGYGYDEWVTTGADGCVVVSGLDSGTYTVTEELKAGWYNTRPGGNPPYAQDVTVEAGADCARVEFGNREEIRDIPPQIPAMNKWGIIAMITVFAGLLVWTVRRKRLAS